MLAWLPVYLFFRLFWKKCIAWKKGILWEKGILWKKCVPWKKVVPWKRVVPWKNLHSFWKRIEKREWAVGGFWLFVTGLMTLALEGEYGTLCEMAADAAERIVTGRGISLVPFCTIGGFFKESVFDAFVVNIVGNIVMFIPWGFGLPLLWKRRQSVRSGMLCSLALPLCIETCQLFIGRSVDIDDVILNFLGGCLGAGVHFAIRKCVPDVEKLAR